ncbi:polyprenyl synthetase family protein [Leuconostoc mesenteroides]|jgi:Geranylgeranyl pyrophosphate synthase|uniref:polyprenyl synthetase family protein n=1 Tax=Leuconostoc mesenteroides TaxID=1245 RepID=UPI0002340BB3|nr:polyprenyl synthetase family protein [Leuconostoc mesenteroides]AET29640.1 geranylgeranyl pyrophosphate synthase [Leuconostoc mesenteroides subsp. mesenteroides J18]AKP36249.1 geranylgeranyl pyrophosphate synthase [Leuconostoc mesenteroides subsp. dextranicum]AQU48649.1 geranylgeranyl pyrophosphate synthase [Leuconostoc mesenteroides subsp. mesenteroides]MBD9365248.1 polyprenyl synthetase family protein [Leuconostoc mesenteroides]MBS0942692.1 polyprenyl synthetase family protein [Leuconosto
MAMPSLPKIWDTFPELNPPLQNVLIEMSESWRIGFSEIDNAIRSQASAGKLVRPALTLLFSELTDAPYNQKAIVLGASIELLHLATLIHDDIIDESKLRRGQDSIQAHFGKDTAVYAGDYLLTGMLSLLNDADNIQANKLALEALRNILFGELTQKHNRYLTDTSFDNYLTQITGKTAALFKLSVLFGATSSDGVSSQLLDVVGKLGENLGIAFQLLDDYLDFESITEQLSLGKPAGQDIRNGIYTAPILFALENPDINAELKELLALRDGITDDQLVHIHNVVLESDAMSRLNSLLAEYSQELDDLLNKLPNNALRQKLSHLATLLLNRKN